MINIANFFNENYPKEEEVAEIIAKPEFYIESPVKKRVVLQTLSVPSPNTNLIKERLPGTNIWSFREEDKENLNQNGTIWKNLDEENDQILPVFDIPRTVYLGNLDKLEVQAILDLIFKFFDKENIEIVTIHQTGNSKKKYGFIQFFTEEDAQEFLKINPKKEFKDTPMKKWVIDKVRSFNQNPETSLFIYVTKEMTDQDIYNIFKNVLKIQIMSFERSVSKSGKKLNYGFIYLFHKSDLDFILKNQNLISPVIVTKVKEKEGVLIQEKKDKPIYIYHFDKDLEKNKSKILKKLDVLLEKEQNSLIEKMIDYLPFDE